MKTQKKQKQSKQRLSNISKKFNFSLQAYEKRKSSTLNYGQTLKTEARTIVELTVGKSLQLIKAMNVH